MTETRKLTLEIDVPADKVPENATGRLLWQSAKAGTPVIGEFSEPCVLTEDSKQMELVIETRKPWRVPEHLRHARYNGWTIHTVSGSRDAYCVTAGGAAQYMLRDRNGIKEFAFAMRLDESDFDGIAPGAVYKLGEGI